VVDAMLALPEKLRFPRGLRAWVGFRQTGIEYDRPTRQAGRPKYGLRRLYRLATDGIASSSIRPLRVAQLFSFCFAILTVVILVFLVGALIHRPASEDTLYFLLAYLLIAGGNFVQAFCFYVLGAYVGRTYLETKGRPSYLVMDTFGDDER
jgi:dolichol-phosphate mannosyltransferase